MHIQLKAIGLYHAFSLIWCLIRVFSAAIAKFARSFWLVTVWQSISVLALFIQWFLESEILLGYSNFYSGDRQVCTQFLVGNCLAVDVRPCTFFIQ